MDWDDAYSNGAYIAGAETYPPRWAAAAKAWREQEQAAGRAELDLVYGTPERHRYDLFHPEGTPKGLAMFVHGGYWMAFDKSSWSHLAAGAQARGWAVAMPSYDLCPEVHIADITRQIAMALATVATHIGGPIALAGHSAGGHLVARMLGRDVVDADLGSRISRVVPISPLSDLRPLLKTVMNEKLRLDIAEAEAESPVLMKNRYDAVVTPWVGARERPAFLDQARWLGEAWGVEHVVEKNHHHFDVIDSLAQADSALVAAWLGD